MDIIKITNLNKSIGSKDILNNINFNIIKGSYTAIIGENGSGKTSLIKILSNLDKDYSGEVLIFNEKIRTSFSKIKLKTGFMFQNVRYNHLVTLNDIIKLYSKIFGKNYIDNFYYHLNELNIYKCKDDYIENLSGGQIQKFNLILSIFHKPSLLILDEPTSAIDPSSRKEIWNILLALKSYGTTIFLSSHNLEEVSILCDCTIIISNGRIVEINNKILKGNEKITQ